MRIEISTSVFFLWGILILTVPINWLLAAMFAATVHELFHAVAIIVSGGSIHCLKIGVLGATMDAGVLDVREEFFSAIAGPGGSFFLLLLWNVFPRIALCGLFQGMYNLLPLYPLDGGRAVLCLMQILCPRSSKKIMTLMEVIMTILLVLLGIFASLKLSLGLLPFLGVVFLLVKLRLRKRPCKQREIRVQ